MVGFWSGETTRNVQGYFSYHHNRIGHTFKPGDRQRWPEAFLGNGKYWNHRPYEGINEPNPLANFENLIQRNLEGRYSVPLPWRTNKKDLLPTNYYRANERFRRLINRLLKEPELFRANHEQILGYLQSGFISKVEAPDQPTTRSEFYLPHRPVYAAKRSKPRFGRFSIHLSGRKKACH